jgi:hypothetical protein
MQRTLVLYYNWNKERVAAIIDSEEDIMEKTPDALDLENWRPATEVLYIELPEDFRPIIIDAETLDEVAVMFAGHG